MFPSPTRMFLTKGVGVHRYALTSFEFALRDADIEQQNLVYVSSIFPPRCQVIYPRRGGRTAQTRRSRFGHAGGPGHVWIYIRATRVRDDGAGERRTGRGSCRDYVATLGLDFDPEAAWNERKQIYEHSSLIIDSTSITAAAECGLNNHWTCAIAAAVFLFS